MALETGSKLGPYEIRGPLGAGGMGMVYRAHDSRLGRDIALNAEHLRRIGHPDAEWARKESVTHKEEQQ